MCHCAVQFVVGSSPTATCCQHSATSPGRLFHCSGQSVDNKFIFWCRGISWYRWTTAISVLEGSGFKRHQAVQGQTREA